MGEGGVNGHTVLNRVDRWLHTDLKRGYGERVGEWEGEGEG
jgi:hypothetical protein